MSTSMTTHQRLGGGLETGVKLPPIRASIADGNSTQPRAAPQLGSTVVGRAPQAPSQLIYRSIPPTDSHCTFSEMLGTNLPSRHGAKSGKSGAVTGNTASEFARRFKARPTTQPKVIEFSTRGVKNDSKRRGINGFFPPVKLRHSAKSSQPQTAPATNIADAHPHPDAWFTVQGITWKNAVTDMLEPLYRNDSRCSEVYVVTGGGPATPYTHTEPASAANKGSHWKRGVAKESQGHARQMTSKWSKNHKNVPETGGELYYILGSDQHPGNDQWLNDPSVLYRQGEDGSMQPAYQEMNQYDFTPTDALAAVSRTTPFSSPMRLQPTSYSEVRARSARSLSRSSRKSTNSMRRTPDSVRTAPPADNYSLYPNVFHESFDCDDLSYLPPPKRILPKRELPWVFRYKVKKNMNELAKIMASRPQNMIDV